MNRTLKTLAVLSLSLVQLEQASAAGKSKSYKARWKPKLSTTASGNATDDLLQVGAKLYVDGIVKISSNLDLKGEIVFSGAAGRSQSDDTLSANRNAMYFDDGFLEYRPLNGTVIRAGLNNQKQMEQTLLLTKRAFPGVVAHQKFNLFGNKFKLSAEAAVPPSSSEGQDIAPSARETTPSFLMGMASYETPKFLGSKLKVSGAYWSYNSLPAVVAYYSERKGNTLRVSQLSGEIGLSEFKYQFKGFSASGDLTLDISQNFNIHLYYNYLRNTEAPTGFDTAQFGKVTLWLSTENVKYGLAVSSYYSESDATVSYYSPSNFSHNNRKGMGLATDIYLKKLKTHFRLSYTDSDVINNDALGIGHEQKMTLSLEKDYASF